MSVVKEAAIRLIQSLPEECSTRDILRHLYMRDRLALARQNIAEGRFFLEAEVDQEMEQWLESPK